MQEPLAYHITWTCYGQWLQGDPRGYVDRQHHTPGEPYVFKNVQHYNASANRMTEPPCWLTDDQRRCAAADVAEACIHRKWRLDRVNVQPDHVHVVVAAGDILGRVVRERLKSWASMQLNRTFPRRQHWWTDGGKVEPIYHEARLIEACEYVDNQRFPRI
jgi:REP element-mobilizing transposase RayT